MTNHNGHSAGSSLPSTLILTGDGGSYIRVSGDKQEVDRQLASKAAFETRHRVKIAPIYCFEDDMPRDLADKRPDFQRMLKAIHTGRLSWIFVDHIDRFGFADEWELVGFIKELREAGCRLIDANDDDWTAHGLMSFFKAGLAGHSSHAEQVTKSHRCLGGMVAKARNGEWMGGPPKLGFDVGCFDRASGEELWRAIFEGRDIVGQTKRRGKMRPVYHIRRRKVYPDGRTERLDGNVVFRTSKDNQIMRITPTEDAAKLSAAKEVFNRYAYEAVSFFDLAKWLNGLGIRNSFGKLFQSRDISKMLNDEAYLGYPTFSKRRSGRFHRFDGEEGRAVELEPHLKGKDTENDTEDVIKSSKRWFDPLVPRPTWDKVQKKFKGRDKVSHAPKNPNLYLAGLVVCSGCGAAMVARTDRMEYYCGTWDKHRVRGTLADSPCERNGVKQVVIEEYIDRYLEDSGKRLELLIQGNGSVDHLTGQLRQQEGTSWKYFLEGIERLTSYLAKHHPQQYESVIVVNNALVEECGAGASEDVVANLVQCYRDNFDPSAVEREIEQLEAEHDSLMRQWSDLPTPRAREKAKDRFTEMEARIDALKQQQQDSAAIVERHYQEMHDLNKAIMDARIAMKSQQGALALRQRAEALRGLLCRIECEFVLSGKRSCGPGNARSKLKAITFNPIAGESIRLTSEMGGNDSRVLHGILTATTLGS